MTPPRRLTMTYHLINSARFIGVLVTGEGKREALGRVSSAFVAKRDGGRGLSVDDLPILGVEPVGGVLRWYLDQDVCAPAGGLGVV